MHTTHHVLALLPLFALFSAGCDTTSSGPVVESVELLGATPSPDFQRDGEVALSILPLDASGEVVLTDDLDLEVYLTDLQMDSAPTPAMTIEASEYTITIQFVDVRAPDGRPLAFALDMDSSGSMADNDPRRLSVSAGQNFITVTNDLRSDAEHGVFTFGLGGDQRFDETLTLQDFTDDVDAARASLEGVSADGGTPLYESAYELLQYFDRQRDGVDWQRSLVLFSDGEPNGGGRTAEQVINRSLDLDIPLYTVGLGPASQTSRDASPRAVEVMQELAFRTGGTYAAVTAADDLTASFGRLAQALASGSVEVDIHFEPSPPSGAHITGEIMVDGIPAAWSIIAP